MSEQPYEVLINGDLDSDQGALIVEIGGNESSAKTMITLLLKEISRQALILFCNL